MRNPLKYAAKNRQSGLSLVELMIGMALGLILLLGVIQVFLSSRQTLAVNDAMSKLQENGRFGLEFISQSARIAGYTSPGTPLSKPFPIEPRNCALNSGAACSANGGGNVSDTVSFTFEPPSIDGAKRDCAGVVIPDNQIIINTYFIAAPDANNPSPALACRSFNRTTNQPVSPTSRLIDGVENMQVLYGIDAGGDSTSVNQFVSADRVTNWGKVLSVRIALLATSIDTISPRPPVRNFYLLDAPPIAPDDGLARQIFTTTIQLKNI
ncbi:PilW family protein [Pseudomonas segetis]|uniref:Tfp pilus assembly protein PilW n=1 Tax=Pseudomonas segetis TaxID=298908 RepID=A0A239D561_9PSED|nr:PilW family protein [Pseudomonas segetis]SNS26974.1 Tfp pilus assembly protein PilW [Pseudomonas segetis]